MPGVSLTMGERYLAKQHVKASAKVKRGHTIAGIETDRETKEIEVVFEHIVSALFFEKQRSV